MASAARPAHLSGDPPMCGSYPKPRLAGKDSRVWRSYSLTESPAAKTSLVVAERLRNTSDQHAYPMLFKRVRD
jgi:hypothetical protein